MSPVRISNKSIIFHQTDTLLKSATSLVAVDVSLANPKHHHHTVATHAEFDLWSCAQKPSPNEYLFSAT